MKAHHVAGWASFCAWMPVTGLGLLLSFSILVFVGLAGFLIGSCELAASVRVARGSSRSLALVLPGAIVLLAWLLVPPLFVAHSTPESAVGWAIWTAEFTLVLVTVVAGTASVRTTQRSVGESKLS